MARKHKRKDRFAYVEELVTPTAEQLANGTYRGEWVLDENTGLKAWAHRNSEHDPIERWRNGGKLEAHQLVVVDKMRRLWQIAGLHQRVTANYGERIASSGSAENASLIALEAKEDLNRIRDYFPAPLDRYFSIFENVARFGMAAGVAGSELGFGSRSSQDRAHQIVCFVADIIATKENI